MTHQVKLGTKPVNGSRGYFLCKCDECGWLGSSEEATGGDELYYCPICSAQEPDEQVGAAQVFNTMLAHIDAQAARIAELERDAILNAAANRACRDLPDGWQVEITLERGTGTVALYKPWSQQVGFDSDNEALADKVNDAIETAIATVKGGAA